MHRAWSGDYHSLRDYHSLLETIIVSWRLLLSPGDYHSLQFHQLKVAPLINLGEVTAQERCYCNSNNYDWHKSNQSEFTPTRLLRQESTITCCDRFVRNCVNIDNTDLWYPQNRAHKKIPNGWPYQRLSWNQSERSLPPVHSLSNALCTVWDMHKSASQVKSKPFRWSNLVVWSTPLCSINHPRPTDTSHSNTLDNTDWQQRRTVDPSESGWYWPVSSRPWNCPDEHAEETLH